MIKVGVFLPQGWRLDLPKDLSPIEQWKIIVNVAEKAEELGFDSVWVFDHFHTYPKALSGRSVFEAWTTLTAISQVTKRVRLGTLVTCILYRYPTVLAKIVANLDVMSGGRVEFGVGACWYEHEFIGYGIEFPEPPRRVRVLDEALQIIKMMWTLDEVNFEGRYFRIRGALNDPKPVQKPHPPILVAGKGEKLMLRVVAKHADKYHIWGTPEFYSRKLDVLKKHCKAIGRNYDEIIKVHDGITIMGTEEEVKRKMKESAYIVLSGMKYESLKRSQYLGTPEEIVERVKEYMRLGTTEFIFYFPDAYKITPLEEFADNVLPQLKKL
ncbi:MAG: LLM class F420-dependent oxidoreductase [Thermoprotei archaeon]|nr:MAG: LLM class F420-dependent oxidoreductase [Thermoprotei archaeon]RLF02397.1 MAG: LLM class F420-dependent oxidoreductase [Thermoprotei archaeon]